MAAPPGLAQLQNVPSHLQSHPIPLQHVPCTYEGALVAQQKTQLSQLFTLLLFVVFLFLVRARAEKPERLNNGSNETWKRTKPGLPRQAQQGYECDCCRSSDKCRRATYKVAVQEIKAVHGLADRVRMFIEWFSIKNDFMKK
jgi:hypothetical protein